MNYLDILPNELMEVIVEYLDDADIIHLGLVCKRFSKYDVAGDYICKYTQLYSGPGHFSTL